MPAQVTKVLIVDDSALTRELLKHVLGSDTQIEVVATAAGGTEALQLLEKLQPDVITVDVNMPGMNGFDLTRQIMESRPVPVVIVTTNWTPDEVATTFRAMEAGAVAVVGKPAGPGHPDHHRDTRKLLETVKAMSEVKVVKRWARLKGARGSAQPAKTFLDSTGDSSARPMPIRFVAIGASTGGPLVLKTILGNLPQDFAAPILIVQHIAPGFLQGLADWLSTSSPLRIRVASHGELTAAGHVYLAPDGLHMGIGPDARIRLDLGDPDTGLRPSVAHLFSSAARSLGASAAGVLLTGMGRDGADALLTMKQQGALTVAQDAETSVIFGMPGEAVKLGAAEYVLPPERIVGLLAGAVLRR